MERMDSTIKVRQVAKIMKDTVSCVQRSVENLAGVHAMKEALKQVEKMRDELDEEERDTLDTRITPNEQVVLVVHHARDAVRTCKSIVRTVRRVITAGQGDMSEKLNLAIHVYFNRVEGLIKKLQKARDELVKSQVELGKVIERCKKFKRWCKRKISKMDGQAEFEVGKQRTKAYGGAFGITAVLAGGMVWWNPAGWVAQIA